MKTNNMFRMMVMAMALTLFTGTAVAQGASNKKNQFSINPKEDNPKTTKDFPGGIAEENVQETNVHNKATSNDAVITAVAPDSAFYTGFTKRNGWIVGTGKRFKDEKEASHASKYVKLSKNNAAGNWTCVETFNGCGTPIAGFTTYLVNQYDNTDEGVNKEWRERLKTVCKVEFVADASGEMVVQERGLDWYGNVVWTYTPVKVGERKYTGSYTDAWGMPMFMRTDSLGNDIGYANVVHITRDERGYEVLYAYTDRLGYPAKNEDGAYMTAKEYDENGNQISEASLNMVGERMTDDWGNCGWVGEYTEDGKRHTEWYRNADWKPMVMPRSDKEENRSVWGWRLDYDDYGRLTEQTAIDTLGIPALEKTYKYSKIKYKYDEHGFVVFMGYYNLDDSLVAGEKNGIAQVRGEYSGDYLTLYECLDSIGKYVNNDEGICKREMLYDSFDNCISRTDYVSNDDSLEISFEYRCDEAGNVRRTWYDEGLENRDTVDSRGRDILEVWYDLNGKPAESNGWHRCEITYEDGDKWCKKTTVWLEKDGNYVDEVSWWYSKLVEVRDSSTCTNTKYMYNSDGVLVDSNCQRYTPDFSEVTQEWGVTPLGEHARTGENNMLYYTVDADYTIYGKLRTFVGKNEWGEPAYIKDIDNSGEVYHFADINKWGYYDEDGNEIEDMELFKAMTPEVYCIEVTDTSALTEQQLRNGDVIISYGDWILNQDLKTDLDRFYLETVLQTGNKKQATLLRHNVQEGTSEVVSVELQEGKTSDLGFYPHRIYYTRKEMERLKRTCKSYGVILDDTPATTDTTILMVVQTKGNGYGTPYYYKEDMKDAGILLGIHDEELYLTQDLETLRVVHELPEAKNTSGGLHLVRVGVNSDTFHRIKESSPMVSTLVIGTVAGEEGYFVEKGKEGMVFIVLKWCEWECTQSLDEFKEEFEMQQDNTKDIVLLPCTFDEEGDFRFLEVMHLPPITGKVGLLLQDLPSDEEHVNTVIEFYEQWKDANKKGNKKKKKNS